VIAAITLVSLSGVTGVKAQLTYEANHLYIGQLPQVGTSIGTQTNLFIGTKFGIAHQHGGLNFYIAWPEAYQGDFKLFISENGHVGVGRQPVNHPFEVQGSILAAGDVYSNGIKLTSDERLKRNIKDMEEKRADYVKKLGQLKGKTYEKLVETGKDNAADIARMVESGRIPKEAAQAALDELNARKKDTYRSEYGFIAQDVRKLFPELVEEDAGGLLSVDYIGLIPVMLEAIKDLQDRLGQLEQRNVGGNDVTLRSGGNSMDGANDLITGSSEYLSQNIPNPVNGSTVIHYNLPEEATQAFISVFSISGSTVKTYPIDVKAKSGSITLHASELAKGINVYNLTVNGAVLSSKRMINP
jgi:hypothetical protein